MEQKTILLKMRSLVPPYYLVFYFLVILILYSFIPTKAHTHFFLFLGLIGFWRYSWWAVHVIRSSIYHFIVFPKLRRQANAIWNDGWRPNRLLFMMTTYHETPSTTKEVLDSIIRESLAIGVQTELYVGLRTDADRTVIQEYLQNVVLNIPFNVTFVKQNHSGKRSAISDVLRVMNRNGLSHDDIVIFMDGDTYFNPNCLKLCLPFFKLSSKLEALTTHESVIVTNGPIWFTQWLKLRFAQRHLTMQSYALSKKVLALTGRMSIFRGTHLVKPEFIQLIENDHLSHWLWGTYRFLSGDDKSTWYFLLKNQSEMLYIPDAITTTIESIHGSPFKRIRDNLKRWCGNTLRNGARAIRLGPNQTGWFIWWCLIDQRLSMWSFFMGIVIIISLTLTQSLYFFFASLLWIAGSRLIATYVLSLYGGEMHPLYPLLLYLNQMMTTVTKISILFKLPQQQWTNRGNQSSNHAKTQHYFRQHRIASLLTCFYITLFMITANFLVGIFHWPTLGELLFL